ncbi:MAG: hypothetical protein LGR52_07575 [Candidatus Thiosymbion ectosymbiont of Robbea hypermnestra]|nr:hypothetical protein [Candidatus Thiosymbion ectosymbiont of Robbea hypermnestra]
MRFLLSGEGPSDIGRCIGADPCVGDTFEPGPMAWLLDQVVEVRLHFSAIGLNLIHALSEQLLQKTAKKLKPPSLRGRKRPAETAYYFRNARALAKVARELGSEWGDEVIAVLFRDADGTQSTGRDDWESKWRSMIDGFAYEGFPRGVPMIPKPKSEAWLLCALKPNQPYEHCDALEHESGNDAAPSPLKAQLEEALGKRPTSVVLSEQVRDHKVEAARIRMESFNRFRERLEEVL